MYGKTWITPAMLKYSGFGPMSQFSHTQLGFVSILEISLIKIKQDCLKTNNVKINGAVRGLLLRSHGQDISINARYGNVTVGCDH